MTYASEAQPLIQKNLDETEMDSYDQNKALRKAYPFSSIGGEARKSWRYEIKRLREIKRRELAMNIKPSFPDAPIDNKSKIKRGSL